MLPRTMRPDRNEDDDSLACEEESKEQVREERRIQKGLSREKARKTLSLGRDRIRCVRDKVS